jgi:uncharacterized damage-inducible protein DinB
MPIADGLVAEFHHETKVTRTLLARVPDDRASWKPHDKSMSLGELAIHLANIPSYGLPIATKPELDFQASAGSGVSQGKWTAAAEALALFDKHVEATRRAIGGVQDAQLREPWTLRSGSHVVFTLPRMVAWRSLVMSHQIHHRGQLSVYLRLNNIAVPSIYGPSADEQ